MLSLPIAPDALPPQEFLKCYLKVQRYGFAIIGVDPTSLERTVYNRFLAWIPFLCIVVLLLPMNLYALEYMDIDLVQAATALSPMWQSLQSIVKFILFMWRKRQIVQLVRNVWLWTMEANEEEVKILAEENRFDRKLAVLYYISVYITGGLALLGPLIAAWYYSVNGYGFLESLEPPLKGQYFVDYHSSYLLYALVYAWVATGVYCVVNVALAIDSLFSWFTRNISAQFRILSLRFEKAANIAIARKAQGLDSEEEFIKTIIECVQQHWRIIQLVDTFNGIYKHIVFIKFIISCVQIACLSFQLTHEAVFTDLLFTVAFLLAVTIQLMLYCHSGQRIQDVSTSVDAVITKYFRWNDLSRKSRKMLLLPMMRAQKPCNISGIFFIADLALFVWVYRSAASFVTMMMSMYKT